MSIKRNSGFLLYCKDVWFLSTSVNSGLSIPEARKSHRHGYTFSWRGRNVAETVQHGFNPTRGIPGEGDLWLADFLLQYLRKQIVSPNLEMLAPLLANEIREANFLGFCPSCHTHQNEVATEVPLEKSSSPKHTGRVCDLTNLYPVIRDKDEGCLTTEEQWLDSAERRVVGCKVSKALC